MRISALLFLCLAACSGKTAGVDLTNAAPPTEPPDPKPDAGTPPGDPPPTCEPIEYACDPGDVQVAGPADCENLACYSRGTNTACTQQIWCAVNHVGCGAIPRCNPDETTYTNGCPPLPVGYTCRSVTVCESTVYCVSETGKK